MLETRLGQFAPEESLFKQDLTVGYINNAQYYDMVQKKNLESRKFLKSRGKTTGVYLQHCTVQHLKKNYLQHHIGIGIKDDPSHDSIPFKFYRFSLHAE